MARLDLGRIRIDGPISPANDADVEAVERELGVVMPNGYREYVTTLGGGSLDMLIRVLPPTYILEQVEEHRSRFATGWFWGPSDDGFDQDAAMTSIPIADTLDGDAITLWPSDLSSLFILPRHEERLVVRPADLLEVVEWICAGGLGHEPSPERFFTPWDGQAEDRPPRATVAVDLGPAPDLSWPPRELLLAYFAELEAVESWAAAQDGLGGQPFDAEATAPTEDDIAQTDELIARSAAAHARYGTARFATSMGGASVAVASGDRQEHDPTGVRVLDETPVNERRVRIRAVHGTALAVVNDYVFEQSGNEWRIASMRMIDVIAPPSGGLGARIRRLLGRE